MFLRIKSLFLIHLTTVRVPSSIPAEPTPGEQAPRHLGFWNGNHINSSVVSKGPLITPGRKCTGPIVSLILLFVPLFNEEKELKGVYWGGAGRISARDRVRIMEEKVT